MENISRKLEPVSLDHRKSDVELWPYSEGLRLCEIVLGSGLKNYPNIYTEDYYLFKGLVDKVSRENKINITDLRILESCFQKGFRAVRNLVDVPGLTYNVLVNESLHQHVVDIYRERLEELAVPGGEYRRFVFDTGSNILVTKFCPSDRIYIAPAPYVLVGDTPPSTNENFKMLVGLIAMFTVQIGLLEGRDE